MIKLNPHDLHPKHRSLFSGIEDYDVANCVQKGTYYQVENRVWHTLSQHLRRESKEPIYLFSLFVVAFTFFHWITENSKLRDCP